MATALDASTRRRARHLAQSPPERVPRRIFTTPLLLGLVVILVGAWAALAPYAGPRIGFHPDGAPAWQWSSTRTALWLVPGVVAVLAGVLCVGSSRRIDHDLSRGVLTAAGVLAALAGAWLIVGPVVWPVVTSNPAPFLTGTARHRLAVEGGASLGPGAVLLLLAGASLGLGLGANRRTATAPLDGAGPSESGSELEDRSSDALSQQPALEVPPWPRPSEVVGAAAAPGALDADRSPVDVVFDWLNPPVEEPPEVWTSEPLSPVGRSDAADEEEAATTDSQPDGATTSEPEGDPPPNPPPLVDDLPVWGPPEVRFEPEVWTGSPTQASTRSEHPTATYSTRPGMHRPPPGWHRPDLTEPPRSR